MVSSLVRCQRIVPASPVRKNRRRRSKRVQRIVMRPNRAGHRTAQFGNAETLKPTFPEMTGM